MTRGNQTYRFTGTTVSVSLTGSNGTAFQLTSANETDNNYIPAVLVKVDDSTANIIVKGDYNYDSVSFTVINMTTGSTDSLTFDSSPLTLSDASYLGDYTAEDNKEKQVTVLNNLETNSKNVVFASLDLNSDGVYNWVEIGNFVDGVDGTSTRAINSSNYSTVIASVKVNDVLLAGEVFTEGGTTFAIGDLYTVDALSPLTLTLTGNIRGAQGVQGENGQNGQDGADGYTPYIQDGYWYINGVNTNVKAIGTDGTNGQNGQSFQMQSGLYSTPDNWGQSGNVDGDGNALNQLPTLPQSDISGKGYVVYDPLTTPLSPFYDLYFANNGDVNWTIIHPFSGIAGTNGTNGETPYISGGTWWIGSTNTGVAATGPQGPAGPGVPSGGTAGQVLTKVDGTDYNTAWQNASGGGTGGGQTLYSHTISINTPSLEGTNISMSIMLEIITNSNNTINYESLMQYLYSSNHRAILRSVMATGRMQSSLESTTKDIIVSGIYSKNGNALTVYGITDTVTESFSNGYVIQNVLNPNTFQDFVKEL